MKKGFDAEGNYETGEDGLLTDDGLTAAAEDGQIALITRECQIRMDQLITKLITRENAIEDLECKVNLYAQKHERQHKIIADLRDKLDRTARKSHNRKRTLKQLHSRLELYKLAYRMGNWAGIQKMLDKELERSGTNG